MSNVFYGGVSIPKEELPLTVPVTETETKSVVLDLPRNVESEAMTQDDWVLVEGFPVVFDEIYTIGDWDYQATSGVTEAFHVWRRPTGYVYVGPVI